MTVETGEFCIVQVSFETEAQANDLNEIALSTYAVDGIEEFSIDEPAVDEILGDRAYSGGDVPDTVIDEVDVETKVRDGITYKYYFFNGDIQRAQSFETYIKEHYSSLELSVENQEFSDWNEEWKKHYAPIEVTNDLRVVPEWYKEDDYKTNNSNIYINPGMGFGTGEHETTFLCLKLYEEIKDNLKTGELCLDFGCGSGILGIGAIKRSNMKVDFVDIDPAALDNCLTNLELNLTDEKMTGHALYGRNRYEVKEKYQLVFANILEHVLISEKNILDEAMGDSAYLVLSGILNEQVENIKEVYSEYKVLNTLSKGDWSAILLKK